MENKKKKLLLFGIGGFICLFLVIGVSYAIWQIVLQQTNENVVTTGCFKINFTEKNDINLNNAYPIVDEAGRKLTPYEFTLENTCDSIASYQVNLEVLDATTLMNHEYIKVMFDEKAPKILTKYSEVEKTLENATTSYKLGTGILEANTSKTFTLRLWMDEDTPPVDEAMNKIFKSKVTITSVYEEKLPGTLKKVEMLNPQGMWSYRSNITKLIVQDKLEEIPTAIAVNDESLLKDKSIMSYVVENAKASDSDTTTYTAYLQGNKIIYLNPDSSDLFSYFNKLQNIEGMEYLDTSKVTNMTNMFVNCSSLINLDLRSFDTSNVIQIRGMFSGCSGLTSLDISPLDTTKVVDMSHMFSDCRSLTSLDLSSFNTASTAQMYGMFNDCRNLTSLDISNFDTSNVTNMNDMFYDCSGLTHLDLSNFNTSNVTDMSGMFYKCSSLTSLDLSNFDTVKVTNMSDMFYDCSSLINLDISNFNTSSVSKYGRQSSYEYGMFQNCTNLATITYGENFVYKDGAVTTDMFLRCPANKPTHESWNGVFS